MLLKLKYLYLIVSPTGFVLELIQLMLFRPPYILVVDDVPDNLLLFQVFLESKGSEVDAAKSGKGTLAKLQAYCPDLIPLDLMMPDMNGYELTQAIRQNDKLKGLPVLLITACCQTDLPLVSSVQESAPIYTDLLPCPR